MLRVLLADDNPRDLAGVVDFVDWKQLGLEAPVCARDGAEGLSLALRLHPDIVITDVSMPMMDGLTMIRKILESRLTPKFIIMSCYDEFEYAKAALTYHACDYLLKPIDIDQLNSALIRAAGGVRTSREQGAREKRLREKLENSLPALTSDLMREFLQLGNTTEDMRRRLDYIGVTFMRRSIAAIVQFDAADNTRDEYLLPYALLSRLQEAFRDAYPLYTFIIDANNVACVITGDWPDDESLRTEVLARLSQVKANISPDTGRTVTISLGAVCSDPFQLPQSYHAAEELLASKFFTSGNRIILSSHEVPSAPPKPGGMDQARSEMEEALTADTPEPTAHYAHACFSAGFSSPEEARAACHVVLSLLSELLNERGLSLNDVYGERAQLYRDLARADTISMLEKKLADLLETARHYLQESTPGRYQLLARRIQRMIDKECAGITSISEIADRFYLSQNYANQIFRSQTGMTIGDYLFSARMEKAKILLRDPSARVYEVSDAIGYSSKSYFGVIFKEYTGLTPREYQNRYCKENPEAPNK